MNKRSTQVARLEQSRRLPENPAAEPSESPLYGVAMLKIAMEMKKPGNLPLEDILKNVLSRMNLPEDAFRAYLQRNGGLLKTLARRKKV